MATLLFSAAGRYSVRMQKPQCLEKVDLRSSYQCVTRSVEGKGAVTLLVYVYVQSMTIKNEKYHLLRKRNRRTTQLNRLFQYPQENLCHCSMQM